MPWLYFHTGIHERTQGDTKKDSKDSQCKKPMRKNKIYKHAATFFFFFHIFYFAEVDKQYHVYLLQLSLVLVVSCTVNLYSNKKDIKECFVYSLCVCLCSDTPNNSTARAQTTVQRLKKVHVGFLLPCRGRQLNHTCKNLLQPITRGCTVPNNFILCHRAVVLIKNGPLEKKFQNC